MGDAEIFLSGGNEIMKESRGQAKSASESLSAVLPAVSGHRLLFAFSRNVCPCVPRRTVSKFGMINLLLVSLQS
jgi:hypothetical protein